MGKPSRSKPSRSARKLDRERRERALENGLPVAAVAPSRRVVMKEPEANRDTIDSGVSNLDSVRASSAVAPSLWERLRRIPPSIQLLGAGILVLIGIGLFRRYTETIPAVDDGPADAKDSAQAPAPAPLGSSVEGGGTSAPNPSAPLTETVATPLAASAVVAGHRPKFAKSVTSSAQEPKAPAVARPKPVPQANTASDATPAAAENPY